MHQCGNPKHPAWVVGELGHHHHNTRAQVVLCERRGENALLSIEENYYEEVAEMEAAAEYAAEQAAERFFEDGGLAGYIESAGFEEYERNRGAVSFQEAYDAACPDHAAGRPLREAEQQAYEEAVLRNGKTSLGLEANPRAQAWMERRVDEILAGRGTSRQEIEAAIVAARQ